MAMPLPRDELGGFRIHIFFKPSMPICFLIGLIRVNNERARRNNSGVKFSVRMPEVISSMYFNRRGHARDDITPGKNGSTKRFR